MMRHMSKKKLPSGVLKKIAAGSAGLALLTGAMAGSIAPANAADVPLKVETGVVYPSTIGTLESNLSQLKQGVPETINYTAVIEVKEQEASASEFGIRIDLPAGFDESTFVSKTVYEDWSGGAPSWSPNNSFKVSEDKKQLVYLGAIVAGQTTTATWSTEYDGNLSEPSIASVDSTLCVEGYYPSRMAGPMAEVDDDTETKSCRTHSIPLVSEVTPVAPKVITSDVCEVDETVELPTTNGVTYTMTRKDQHVTVVATPNPGHHFAEGIVTEWEFDLKKGEPCKVEPTVPPTEEPTVPPTDEPTVPPTDEPTVPPTEVPEPVVPEPVVPPVIETNTPPVAEPTKAPVAKKDALANTGASTVLIGTVGGSIVLALGVFALWFSRRNGKRTQ